MEKPTINLWANFLLNEKLDPENMDPEWVMELVRLCEEAAKIRGPKVSPYKARLEARDFIVNLAMDLGIDLPAIKHTFTKKVMMARSLLDAWNRVYIKKYGSNYGTVAFFEAKRRDIKTRLANEEAKADVPRTTEVRPGT